MMKSVIQDKRQQLAELREREERLERENERMVEEIKETDRQMDLDARMLLEKHDQFLSKLALLKQGYQERVELAREAKDTKNNSLTLQMDRLDKKLEDEVS